MLCISHDAPVLQQLLSAAGIENDDDMKTLEVEITELQESNCSLESENSRLRSEVSTLESNLKQHEQDNHSLQDKTSSLSEYLSTLKKRLLDSLCNVQLPSLQEGLREDNFDSYIAQLHTLCKEDSGGDNKALFSAVQLALAGIKLA